MVIYSPAPSTSTST